jgi:hypothetical protein
MPAQEIDKVSKAVSAKSYKSKEYAGPLEVRGSKPALSEAGGNPNKNDALHFNELERNSTLQMPNQRQGW